MNKNIWTDNFYIYKATSSGTNIYDTNTGSVVAFAQYNTGINSVWANIDYVFMATTNSGILWLPISTISGSFDITDQLSVYKSYPDITSDYINYLHGSGGYLCVTTISGVDHINMVTDDRIYTTISGAQKCYQTSSGRFYYCLDDSLNTMYDNTQNWADPDYSYDVGGNIIPDNVIINDIFITEGTSIYQSGNNVIFLATNDGAVVIEERKDDEENSRYKYFFVEP